MKGERKKRKGGEEKRKGGKKRGKKRKGEEKNSTAGLEHTTFHSTANCLQLPPEVDEHTKPKYIANLDCLELKVASLAALAPLAPPTNLIRLSTLLCL